MELDWKAIDAVRTEVKKWRMGTPCALQELAREYGVTPETVSRWRRGRPPCPNPGRVARDWAAYLTAHARRPVSSRELLTDDGSGCG